MKQLGLVVLVMRQGLVGLSYSLTDLLNMARFDQSIVLSIQPFQLNLVQQTMMCHFQIAQIIWMWCSFSTPPEVSTCFRTTLNLPSSRTSLAVSRSRVDLRKSGWSRSAATSHSSSTWEVRSHPRHWWSRSRMPRTAGERR